MSETVGHRIADGIATVTLQRPERLNAMNRELVETLLDVLAAAADDPRVSVVVLTGAGRAFSAGGDRDEEIADSVMGSGDQAADVAALRRVMHSAELLRNMPKITIAAINGPCAGAALALACAADLRIAASTAVFTTAFVPAALSGDFGGTWTLPRIVGEAKARELYLLSDRIDAEEARRIGLVSWSVEPGRFEAMVADLAGRLARSAPTALRLLKANLNDAAGVDFPEALDREAKRIAECLGSDEVTLARDAFRARVERSSAAESPGGCGG